MNVFMGLCGLLGILFGIYFAVTCMGGFVLRRKYTLPEHADAARVAVVIAARNEADVLPKLIGSLLAQDYPRELYDVYVVPNNCTDDTGGAALRAGAKLIHCAEPVKRKGDALRQAFAQLSATGQYDAYCVFDADNLVHPGFLHQVNNAFFAGFDAAQGFRDSKNPFDTWVSGGTSVFYWFMSRVFNESRARLGLNCHLNGTGFMVSDAAIRRLGYETFTLTEDLEFTAQLALNGCRVGWMPEARIYDEQPLRLHDSAVQRRRWTAGSLQCTRRYALRLLKKHTPSSLDIGCLFCGNLMNYVGLISAAVSFYVYLPYTLAHLRFAVAAALTYVVVLGLALIVGAAIMVHMEHKSGRRSLPTIVLFPIFMLTWMPVNLYACLTPPPSWHMVKHTRSIDITEMDP